MQINRLTLHNFGCFEQLNWDCLHSNGLYLITGRNEHNLALGANGIGKSTLFKALCWVLYGKTDTNVKAKRLLNIRAKDGYEVEVIFDAGTIYRSWNPNSLKLNNIEVSQNEIDKFIGLSFEQFIQTVYFGQKQVNAFIDLSASEKLTFFSTIFDLDKWTLYADFAKGEINKLAPKLAKLIGQKQNIDAGCGTLNGQLSQLTTLNNDWQVKQDEQSRSCTAQIESLKSQILPSVDISDLQSLAKEIEQQFEASKADTSTATDKVHMAKTQVQLMEGDSKTA